MRKILGVVVVLVAVLLVLLGVAGYRTTQFRNAGVTFPRVEGMKLDESALALRLAGALRIKTLSAEAPAEYDRAPFDALHAYLRETFPTVFAKLNPVVINGHSLLFQWPGSDASLEPFALLAHQDVVPAPAEAEKDWTHPPFSGDVADGFIWGRGALDDKSSLLGILEAVEALLKEGVQPARTLYLAFGHDEEVGGGAGAPKIVEALKAQGVHFDFVLDEGGTITEGIIPGVSVPVAIIGIGEKGYLSLELSVDAEGGHSSAPPRNTAIGILAKAITRIEDHPFPASLENPIRFFSQVGPEMPFAQRAVFANLWLTAPLVKQILAGDPHMNASMRTTAAATMCSGGIKDNVLPSHASAIVNFRLIPGDSVDSVTERVRKTIGDDRVKLKPLAAPSNPSRISSTDSDGYRAIVKAFYETAAEPGAVVAPFVELGASDSRHYEPIATNVYRFMPATTNSEDLKRFHGVNERIAVSDYARMVQFYARIVRDCGGIR